MDETGTRQVTPRLRDDGPRHAGRARGSTSFSSGYMQRMMHRFPKQGDHEPWINPQNYARDKKMIRLGALEDGALVFDNPKPVVRQHDPRPLPALRSEQQPLQP